MIQINLQFETGAEARQALLDLLHGGTTIVKREGILDRIAIKDEKIAENFETPKTEIGKDEIPEQEILITKKRRTKAEIEAEKIAEAEKAEKEISGEVAEEVKPEEPKASAITKEMLQEKAVNLIRNGKKAEVTETIKKFGADSISQADKNPVKTEDYAALMDAFNSIG